MFKVILEVQNGIRFLFAYNNNNNKMWRFNFQNQLKP